MSLANLIGQTLDGKYKIERELGRGGMGAVYLATHVGTERAVALKVIAPEFMRRAEFIERFRREARAAGRLRHPNVVDVTDFGLAETATGRVAYLVMEYLDGCTLGEVLEEENRLPLSWTLDILEQTCSAVDEAHRQGIIHRDLKPDNIWLEPNARGGYTVKVLDFGIAKLEDMSAADGDTGTLEGQKSKRGEEEANGEQILNNDQKPKTEDQIIVPENQTLALSPDSATEIVEDSAPRLEIQNPESRIPNPENGHNENATIALPDNESADATAIFPAGRRTVAEEVGATSIEAASTKILSDSVEPAPGAEIERSVKSTAALTRVGAVLGTPLYMSPEQCRGERLDPRADVYSLGVIAYQMLSGATPFAGKYTDVLEAHKTQPPPPLEAKKIPKGVKKVVASAMAKMPYERPASALSFASKMRAQSEGIGVLLQRALIIYSENLPTFLSVAILLSLPMLFFTLAYAVTAILTVHEVLPRGSGITATVIIQLLTPFVNVFFAAIMTGVTTWLVAEHLAVPLRPIRLRPAFREARKHLRTFGGTVMLLSFVSMFGLFFCLVPGYVLFVLFTLLTPVVMMEGLRGRRAASRSIQLAQRSLRTVAAVTFLHLFVPMILAGIIALGINLMITGAKSSIFGKDESAPTQPATENQKQTVGEQSAAANQNGGGVEIAVGTNSEAKNRRKEKTPEEKKAERIEEAWRSTLFQMVWLPIVILIGSFASVVTSLLYLKTRRAGGEATQDLLQQFEENELPQSRWQQRVRERLVQSGRQTGRTSTASKT